jgi:hypothetical protein
MLYRPFAAIIISFYAYSGCAIAQPAAQSPTGSDSETKYGILKVGAGGAVTGIDIQCDLGVGACSPGTGTVTKLSRNNTNGAYWFNPNSTNCGNAGAKGCWQQIVSVHSLPANDPSIADGLRGAYDAVIAPSNTSHFWMIYDGYIYSSLNKGATWSRCSAAQDIDDESNGAASGALSRHIAVDPANEWAVIAATPTIGVIYSDGTSSACSNSWTNISTDTIPAAAAARPCGSAPSTCVGDLVAYDPSTTSGGSTPGIYVFVYGHGVYHTSTGLKGSWSLTLDGPTQFCCMMIVDAVGNVWTIDDSTSPVSGANGGFGHLWRCVHSGTQCTWSKPATGQANLINVAVDPNNAARVIVGIRQSDQVSVSTDAGATWSRATPTSVEVATDIPWLAYVNAIGGYFAGPTFIFDPSASNTMWSGNGVGVATSNPPTAKNTLNAQTYTSVSAAIEQIVANWIVAPDAPGAVPVVATWDWCVIQPGIKSYPSAAGIKRKTYYLQSGWSVDWASANPNVIVAICQGINDGADLATSGYSTDGGAHWSPFTSEISTGTAGGIFGGCIAASSSSVILQVQSNQPPGFPIWYTTDGGASWHNPDNSLTSITSGWHQNYYNGFRDCAADRVDANTFYLYNFNNGRGGDAVYRSTNSGLTWTQQCTYCRGHRDTFGSNGTSGGIKTAPGLAGYLCVTTAYNFNAGIPHNFWCSTNAGQTWTAPTNVEHTLSFGFGKAKVGNGACGGRDCPAIYLAGAVDTSTGYTYGYWRSDDWGAHWTKIGDGYPLGSFSQISDIDGDKNTYGTFYVCLHGPGCFYGALNYLLNRDLDPASNDDTPAGGAKAA